MIQAPNGAVLTAHEATIQTASVEIQTLRVGKKQVTMGMFRQLPPDPLLDLQTLQLRGVPWGHVRYWWDGDGRGYEDAPARRSAKLHVVWQLGETLRRGVVYETPHGEALDTLQGQHRALLEDLVVLQVARAEHVVVVGSAVCDVHLDTQVYRVTVANHQTHVLARYWGTHAPQGTGYTHESRQQAAEDYAALLEARGLTALSRQAVYAGLAAATSERDSYLTRWAKQWQVLRALPQLFIAV